MMMDRVVKLSDLLELAVVNEPMVKLEYKLSKSLNGAVIFDAGAEKSVTEAMQVFGDWEAVALDASNGYLTIEIKQRTECKDVGV